MKIFRFFTSRMVYFIFGLSFSVLVIAVNAAVTINSGTVTSGEMLTAARWNTMVNDLIGIRDEVNKAGFLKVTNTCRGTLSPKCLVANNNQYLDISCPSDYPIVIGGDCIYKDDDLSNYPRLDRSTSGEILNDNTYRCYFWNDGNGNNKGMAYCAKF